MKNNICEETGLKDIPYSKDRNTKECPVCHSNNTKLINKKDNNYYCAECECNFYIQENDIEK